MFEPLAGESVAVTSQKPGNPFASSTHLPLALVAPSIAGVTAEQRSAPARAGKLAAEGPSSACEAVQPAASAASATEASSLMIDPFQDLCSSYLRGGAGCSGFRQAAPPRSSSRPCPSRTRS